jgi:hypothetical protein
VKCALCASAHTANYKGCLSLNKISITSHKKVHTKITPFTPPTVLSKDLPVTDMLSLTHTQLKGKYSAKTYAKITAGNSNNPNIESILVILSQFVSQLNSLITPLISLVSTLLQLFPRIPYLLKFIFAVRKHYISYSFSIPSYYV